MAQAVLALGAATVAAAGCVWYLPALADLRAGADRPLSCRRAAAACLGGWATVGVVAVLLLVSEAWWIPSGAAVAGAVVTLGLRVRASRQRSRESREAAYQWAELGDDRQPADTEPVRTAVVAVLVGFGPAAAVAAAAAMVVVRPGQGAAGWVVAAVPTTIVVLFLAVAAASGRVLRRHRADASGRRR
ncbi:MULTISPECIES: hypothetical protein [unclassified Streptomyces]|uniref:hypothetical protein n=1 Tax=unclassified Streptomyces TaxID=2593676 RepID=UPI003009BC6D